MKFHAIGLTGLASTGKDTVAALLKTHCGFLPLAFADSLRGEVAEGFGIDLRLLADPHTKNEPTHALAMRDAPLAFCDAVRGSMEAEASPRSNIAMRAWLDEPRTPRQILQWWGTEYRRRQSANYWTSSMARKIHHYRREGVTRFVLTDCRFDNEVDVVRALMGQLWQITRPGIDASTTPEGTAHVSATDGARFKPDVVIANNHDMRHLQQLVLSEFYALDSGIPGLKVTT